MQVNEVFSCVCWCSIMRVKKAKNDCNARTQGNRGHVERGLSIAFGNPSLRLPRTLSGSSDDPFSPIRDNLGMQIALPSIQIATIWQEFGESTLSKTFSGPVRGIKV
jgi:hypothetical protein